MTSRSDDGRLTIVMSIGAAHATEPLNAATDAIMELSWPFKVRNAQGVPPYDWNDAGCSVPRGMPFTSKFKLALPAP